MGSTSSPEELHVWKRAVDLSVEIYSLTDTFPKSELYGITAQMRRAAVSVPSNIAEGRRRSTDADFAHFLHIADGSLAELETQLLISRRIHLCDERAYARVRILTVEVSKMLHGMIKKLQ